MTDRLRSTKSALPSDYRFGDAGPEDDYDMGGGVPSWAVEGGKLVRLNSIVPADFERLPDGRIARQPFAPGLILKEQAPWRRPSDNAAERLNAQFDTNRDHGDER